MKSLIAVLALALTSASAFAHSGGHHISCTSAANSGSKQRVEFSLNRSNGSDFGAAYSLRIDGKKADFSTEDEGNSLGQTIHNSPLGVIVVTADNQNQENVASTSYFSLTAIPSTVKAFTADGKRNKWSLNAEKNECNDANGSAKFKAIFRGHMSTKKANDQSDYTDVPVQIMDCDMEYDSGMAC